MANANFGPAATLLAINVDGHTSMLSNQQNAIFFMEGQIADAADDLEQFNKALNDSELPLHRVGVLLRLLNRVLSPYQEPYYTGGPGTTFTGTILRPNDLFDPDLDGSFQFGFGASRDARWDFNAPAYVELSYQRVPTTDPDALLEVEYRFDNQPWKVMRHPSGSHGYIRGYGTFLELRGPANPGPPHPNLRLLRNVLVGGLFVGSYVTIVLISPSEGLPVDWNVPPEDPDDPDEGDEEDSEPEDPPPPMAKRIRLSDAAIKMEFYDKEE